MTIDWLHFLFALFLLWLPRQFLRWGAGLFRKRQRHRSKRVADINPSNMREPGDPRVVFSVEFRKVRNYIDLMRAALGTAILLGGLPGMAAAVSAAEDAPAMTTRAVFFGQILILAIAVMIQSFRIERRPTMFAPIFFLSGLAAGMCGLYAAGFSLVLIWTINLALPNPAAFLSIFALLAGLFGMVFLGMSSDLPIYATLLIFLPVLVSLLARRRLVQFSKKVKPAGTSSAPAA